MAKISARGDRAIIRLRKPNGGYVVLTEHGRLLEQHAKGSGYTLVAPHWVTRGSAITHRESVTRYLLDHRYPDAEVLA